MGTRRTAARRTKRRHPSGLASALFTGTQQRVLGLLFGQADRSFFATEMIGLAKAGSGAVQRELQHLTDAGLVVVKRVGNQKHYQANPASPIFEELRGIATKTLGPAEELRKALAPLENRIQAAWLFGSIAKGTDRAQSDIDVLIVSEDLALDEAFSALAPAEAALGRTISPQVYRPDEFEKRRADKGSFVSKVMQGELIPLIGSKDAVASA